MKDRIIYFVQVEQRLMSLKRYCDLFGLHYGSTIVRISRMKEEERKKYIVDNIMYIPVGDDLLDGMDRRTLRCK